MRRERSIRPLEVALGSLVSVIINNYNYGRFIADAIDSALAQTYSNCEVIVVDDGSQDNSREVIARFGNRVKTVFKSNGGQSSAFNAGYAESSGDVICFLDSDDVFFPNKVERVVDGFATSPHGWCFHHMQWGDTDLKPIFTPPIPFTTGKYDFRSEQISGKCTFAPPATSGLTFSRTLLNQLMPIPEAITITSDNYLKFSSLALEPGYFIAEQYALQRMHGKNAYTGRKDETLRADVDLSIASGLRAKVPAMRSLCNRWYADGIVRKWGAGASIGSIYKVSQEYLTDMSFAERVEIVARIAYKAARRGAYALAKTQR
jgi:glycosyltransferase involved in cell wall biosynthesis